MKKLAKKLFYFGLLYCSTVSALPIASGHNSYANLLSTKMVSFIETSLENNLNSSEYVLSLEGGKVYEDGIVLTNNNLLIDEVTVMAWGKPIQKHPLLTSNQISDAVNKGTYKPVYKSVLNMYLHFQKHHDKSYQRN